MEENKIINEARLLSKDFKEAFTKSWKKNSIKFTKGLKELVKNHIDRAVGFKTQFDKDKQLGNRYNFFIRLD